MFGRNKDKLKPCPWCKKTPRHTYEYWPEVEQMVSSVRCVNKECPMKPDLTLIGSGDIVPSRWNDR